MPLRFIGNWYIDGGIYGFYRLMNRVYGWDLEKLNEELEKNPKDVLTIKFPVGFTITVSSLRNISNRDITLRVSEIFEEYLRKTQNIKENNSLKPLVDHYKESIKEVGIEVSNIKLRYDYIGNFYLFNPGKNNYLRRNIFYFLFAAKVLIEKNMKISINNEGIFTIKKDDKPILDRNVMYLLLSISKSKNEIYNNIILDIEKNLKNLSFIEVANDKIPGIFWIPILSFWEAFHKKGNKYYFIYYPNLEKTIEINETIKKTEENKDILPEFISKLPTLLKKEIETSFRMIYILEHEGTSGQQSIKNMKYIPIPWSVSYILKKMLEEGILKENLSYLITLKIKDKKRYIKCNLLKELIEMKESIWKTVSMYQNEAYLKNSLPILYAEAKLIETAQKSRLFSINFLKRYRLSSDIKYSEYKRLVSGTFRKFIDEKKIRDKEIRIAFNKIKEGKKAFIDYILSKIDIDKVGKDFNRIGDFLFNYIIKKGEEWKDYAMMIAISTFAKGDGK